ncbi:MAG: hypothetical protein Q8922_02570 [Bacteroidota bacterium]|nr:hypothetical protein [Bacteroidota bacterium]MDP4234750.1 hypothetical protein [Bacteroidota bacterium]MDP4242642.1 hypothetical protein [Bacteroidota bacterium]MDP4286796.1 hypothetical protein [Bacteroidota bacterium]
MSSKSTFVLVAVLALCACSQSVSVMQTPQVLRPVSATIDFGTVPLWREADTAYALHLNRLDSITSVALSDSDFTLLNSPLSIRKQDSTVSLNIRYQPQSIANHAGSLLLLAGNDTVAMVSLTGGTSPFERHVGDSYVFADTGGRLDSVWVSALPLTLMGGFDVRGEEGGDWIVGDCGPCRYTMRLPFISRIPYSEGKAVDTPYLHCSENFEQFISDTTTFILNEAVLSTEMVSTYDSYDFRNRFGGSGSGEFATYVEYAPAIAFVVRWIAEGPCPVNYRLIRFHLRR